MAKKLNERINDIINDRSFNDLPFEQRKFICKFLKQHQILTLYQAIHSYPELVCGAYKTKIRNWLEDCVESYEKEYSTPKERGADNGLY